MKVTVAKNAGFCFGVERAVNRAYEEASKSDKPIYTYGPIIHNEQVVEDLEQKGIKVVNSLEELSHIGFLPFDPAALETAIEEISNLTVEL